MATDAEIEAVAKALHAAGELGSSWDEAGDMRDVYRQDARAAIEALDALRGGGWMPIESAPKDGTVVICWRRGWPSPATGKYCRALKWAMHDMTQATHWRPLPAPPKEAAR